MSAGVFEASLKWMPEATFNIGGGEPTCHPMFWEFLAMAIRVRGKGKVWMATNGKSAYDAMVLAHMVKKGEIKACLSQDQWHETIRQEVVDLWLQTSLNGKKAIRTVKNPINSGKCDWGRKTCNGKPKNTKY